MVLTVDRARARVVSCLERANKELSFTALYCLSDVDDKALLIKSVKALVRSGEIIERVVAGKTTGYRLAPRKSCPLTPAETAADELTNLFGSQKEDDDGWERSLLYNDLFDDDM